MRIHPKRIIPILLINCRCPLCHSRESGNPVSLYYVPISISNNAKAHCSSSSYKLRAPTNAPNYRLLYIRETILVAKNAFIGEVLLNFFDVIAGGNGSNGAFAAGIGYLTNFLGAHIARCIYARYGRLHIIAGDNEAGRIQPDDAL